MHQQNVIKNPKPANQQQIKGPELTDRDRVNDILATEKYLTDSFNTFVLETSHRQLFNDVKNILNETHDCARNLFNVMFQEGQYKLTAAQEQDIANTQQQFSNYIQTQSPYINKQMQ